MKRQLFLLCFIGCIFTSCNLFYADVTSYFDVSNTVTGSDTEHDGNDETTDQELPGLQYRLKTDGTYAISGIDVDFSGSLKIPEMHKEITITSIDEYAFLNNVGITEICFQNEIELGKGAFQNASSLHTLTIEDVEMTISTQAFANCASLENVNLGETIAAVEAKSFENCPVLKSIIIPASASNNISETAFSSCSNLDAFIDAEPIGTGYSWHSEVNEVYYKDEWGKLSFDSAGGCYVPSIAILNNEIGTLPNGPCLEGSVFKGWYCAGENSQSLVTTHTVIEGKDQEFCASWM